MDTEIRLREAIDEFVSVLVARAAVLSPPWPGQAAIPPDLPKCRPSSMRNGCSYCTRLRRRYRVRPFLVNPNLTPGLQERFAGAEAAAKSLGIILRRVDAATPAELTVAFAAIQESSSQALLVQNDPMLGMERSRILDFAVAHRLPTAFEALCPAVCGNS